MGGNNGVVGEVGGTVQYDSLTVVLSDLKIFFRAGYDPNGK